MKTEKEMDDPIKLESTKLHWGSDRWRFICPLIKNGRPCYRRVGKLYLLPGYEYFGCWNCYELTYTSCQESHKCDSFYKALMRGWFCHPVFIFLEKSLANSSHTIIKLVASILMIMLSITNHMKKKQGWEKWTLWNLFLRLYIKK